MKAFVVVLLAALVAGCSTPEQKLSVAESRCGMFGFNEETTQADRAGCNERQYVILENRESYYRNVGISTVTGVGVIVGANKALMQ